MLEKDGVATFRGLAKVMSASEAGLFRQPFAISLSGDHSAGPIKLARLRHPDDQQARFEGATPAVSLQFKLSLFEPLNSEAASSLIRWMTRDSPASIENIHFADQALTEANETSKLCNQLLDAKQPAQGQLLSYLSEQGQIEGYALLQQLRGALSGPTSSYLSDVEAMQVVKRVKKGSDDLVNFIEDSLARLGTSSLDAQGAKDPFRTANEDLRNRIAMRLTLISEDIPDNQTEIAFDVTSRPEEGQRFRTGLKRGHPVIVEYFYYEDKDSTLLSRVRRISALHAEPKSTAFHSMHGVGFLRETLHGARYGLVYRKPEERSRDTFKPLSELISTVKNVPLEIRMRIAYALCEALLNLHSIGWYHKAIKSHNVLIFGRGSATDNSESSTTWGFDCPYLMGFDCSRPIEAATLGTVDFMIYNNIYRHPDRWNRAAPFERHHDVYALVSFFVCP